MEHSFVDTAQETLVLPFGLYFRQLLPKRSTPQATAQTTSEPEITTGDGKDPDQIDSDWIPDEDEDDDDDDEENKNSRVTSPSTRKH